MLFFPFPMWTMGASSAIEDQISPLLSNLAYLTPTIESASCATYRSSAITIAIGSPVYLTNPRAKIGNLLSLCPSNDPFM